MLARSTARPRAIAIAPKPSHVLSPHVSPFAAPAPRASLPPPLSQCKICPVGDACAKGAGKGTACPAGRYSERTGDASCTTCEAGRWGRGGDEPCVDCPAGRFGIGGSRSGECSGGCNVGHFGGVGAANPNCNGRCEPGRYGLGGSTTASCTGKCLPGHFSHFGASVCSVCPDGKYQAKHAQWKCLVRIRSR